MVHMIDRPSAYQFLLASRDIHGEHPRQDEASLAAVRQVKPFWALGAHSYHWIEDSFLLRWSKDILRESSLDIVMTRKPVDSVTMMIKPPFKNMMMMGHCSEKRVRSYACQAGTPYLISPTRSPSPFSQGIFGGRSYRGDWSDPL